MSRKSEEIIKCPKCGEESNFIIWDSINTVLNPEMVDQVKQGNIFNFIRPKCGEVTQVIYPFLYNMMDKSMMIYYVMEEEVDDTIKMLDSLKELQEKTGVKYRVVCNPNYLQEKIRIFEDDRDDRIIEIMKLVFEANFVDSPQYNGENYNDMIYLNQDGKKTIAILNDGVIVCGYDASDEVYENFCQLSKEFLDDKDEYLIDREWAFSYLEKINDAQ